jgi:hypothetical protein
MIDSELIHLQIPAAVTRLMNPSALNACTSACAQPAAIFAKKEQPTAGLLASTFWAPKLWHQTVKQS